MVAGSSQFTLCKRARVSRNQRVEVQVSTGRPPKNPDSCYMGWPEGGVSEIGKVLDAIDFKRGDFWV